MKNKSLLIYILVFAFVFGGAYFLYSNLSSKVKTDNVVVNEENTQSQTDSESSKVKALDITVTDMNGEKVNLSDYFGKPIVMNFWFSTCGPCQMEMPEFEKVYKEMGEDITFFMVNSTESMDTAKAFIEENEFTMPFYFDEDYSAISTYGISAFPTTLFIDKDGYAVAYAQGMIDEETLLNAIDLIKE